MKKRSFALTMAFMLTLVLAGCSAGREGNTMEPSHSVTGSDSGVYETNNGNDAFEGGGAGGTNDRDNDGQPDSGAGSDAGQAKDDIGRAAGDVARGVGDVARSAGDAIGDAADGVGRAMR